MTIYSTTRNLSSQISTNVSLSHVRTMEHAKTKPAGTSVTVKQASADSTVKAVSKLKSSFRKMQACKRVDPFHFPMRFEACVQFCSQWCWNQMYLILCHSADPFCFHISAYILKHENFLLRYWRMSVPTMWEQWNLHRPCQRLPMWLYCRLQRNQLYNR